MKRRSKIVMFISLGVIAAGFLARYQIRKEPVHQGKTVTQWIKELNTTPVPQPITAIPPSVSSVVVRQIRTTNVNGTTVRTTNDVSNQVIVSNGIAYLRGKPIPISIPRSIPPP